MPGFSAWCAASSTALMTTLACSIHGPLRASSPVTAASASHSDILSAASGVSQ
jgi:hypothetical protein